MTNGFASLVEGGEDAIFGALVDVVQGLEEPDTGLWAVKVSVNPSRFGVDEALSVRLKSRDGEGEIGKFTIRPVKGGTHALTVPKNRTGGAAPPELDPEGTCFDGILTALLDRLGQLGLYSPPAAQEDKGPIGLRALQERDAP